MLMILSNYNCLSISGLRVEYDLSQPNGKRVTKALARCGECRVPKYEPVETNKTYNVIMPSFLTKGGDGYTVLVKNHKKEQEMGTFTIYFIT
jgi:5'-nucleotidase